MKSSIAFCKLHVFLKLLDVIFLLLKFLVFIVFVGSSMSKSYSLPCSIIFACELPLSDNYIETSTLYCSEPFVHVFIHYIHQWLLLYSPVRFLGIWWTPKKYIFKSFYLYVCMYVSIYLVSVHMLNSIIKCNIFRKWHCGTSGYQSFAMPTILLAFVAQLLIHC